MEALDLAQKIKVLNVRQLRVPIVRTAAEPYDEEYPTKFDKNVGMEVIDVSNVVNSLLGIIKVLCKIIMTTNTVHTKESWKVLKDCQRLLIDSKMSVRHK